MYHQGALLLACFVIGCASIDTNPRTDHLVPVEVDQDNSLIPATTSPPRVDFSDDVNFLELRQLYGRRSDYGDLCERISEIRSASEALEADRYGETIEITEDLVESCPVDPSIHIWRAVALKAQSRIQEYEVHKRWYRGLIQSVLDSGDGTTAKTAYVTISIREEYAVLSALGLTPLQQFLVDGGDAILVKDEDGNESTVYFNPGLHFLRLMETFP